MINVVKCNLSFVYFQMRSHEDGRDLVKAGERCVHVHNDYLYY